MSHTAIIDTCDLGHKFAKLDDHPGNSCVHCLRIGLARARAEAEKLRAGQVLSRNDLIQCLLATRGQSEGATADAILSMFTAAPQSTPGVSALVEALERISNMDSMSYHSLGSAKIVARKALALRL